MNAKNKGAFDLVVAMVLSGTIGIFVVESGQAPFNVVFFRCLFGSLSLGMYCYAKRLLKTDDLRFKTIGLISAGGLCIVFNWVFLFKAYQLTSITVATVVYQTQPILVLFIGSALFRTRIGLNKFLWILAAFVGMVFISGFDGTAISTPVGYIAGIGAAVLAALLYAVATLIAKGLTNTKPHVIAFYQVLLGTLVLIPFADFSSTPTGSYEWSALLTLGLVHTCVLYIFLYSGFQKLAVHRIAVLCFIYPVVTMVADYFVYGQQIHSIQGLGLLLILVSNLGVNLNWGAKYRFPKPTFFQRRKKICVS